MTTLIAGIGGVIAAILSSGQSTDAEDFLAGSISEAEFDTALAPANSIQVLVTVATLATAVLSIIWMYRIATNVRAFGRATTWSPLFAIFGWVLPPGVLYVIPFLVLRELWKASDPSPTSTGDRWRQSGDNVVLWVWFALFGLVTAVLFAVDLSSGDLGAATSPNRTTIAESLIDFDALDWLSPLVTLGAAIAWVVFLRQLTARHRQLTNGS